MFNLVTEMSEQSSRIIRNVEEFEEIVSALVKTLKSEHVDSNFPQCKNI